MSCILRITGDKLNVDKLKNNMSIKPFHVFRKGEPIFKDLPKSRKANSSGLSFDVSKADFSDLNKQTKDAIKFLKKNNKDLKLIQKQKGLDDSTLDFGINSRIGIKGLRMQSDTFPFELLKLAGDLGINIELSQYPEDFEEQAEKLSKAKKKNKINKKNS